MTHYHIILFLALALIGYAVRTNGQATQGSEVEIVAQMKNGSYRFSAENKPPLQQIAGAPEAHYSYFWEFGDGEYSFEENPVYAYADTGEVKVNVALTNNYGSGGAPRIKSRRLKINTIPDDQKKTKPEPSIEKKESIKVITNHQPRPGDQMICVITYQHAESFNEPMGGQLYFFFNENEFEYTNFAFEDARQHHGENFYNGLPNRSVASTHEQTTEWLYASATDELMRSVKLPAAIDESFVRESKSNYSDVISWDFRSLQKGETRNIFVTLKTDPQMIRDTAHTITVRAVMVPDFPGRPKEYTHKMVVRTSHDPNELKVSDRNINKKTIRKEGITYTIRFQNVGRGSASHIRINNSIHASLDPSTIKLIDYYPKSNLCFNHDSTTQLSCLDTILTKNEISWQFRNIYLPGTRQSDKESRRATHGWITYNIKPHQKFKRTEVLRSRASIIFDRNKPVETNGVRTHVRRNYAYLLRIGTFDITYGLKGISGAVGLSPFYSRKVYYQPEVGATHLKYEGLVTVQNGVLVGTDGNGDPLFGDLKTTQNFIVNYLDVIPLQMRYTVGKFFNFGAGLQVAFLMSANEQTVIRRTYTIQSFHVPPFPPTEEESEQDALASFPDKTEFNFFADVQGGLVRNGPFAGIRANYRSSNRPEDERARDIFIQLFLGYKF